MKYIKMTKPELEKMKLIYPTVDDCYKKSFSDIYYDDEIVYKILRNDSFLSDLEINELQQICSLNIDSVITPQNIIVIDGINSGFTMEYFEGLNLDKIPSDYKRKRQILINAKNNLLDIHKNNITVGDLHSGNIMFNSENQTKFCDIDGMIITPNVLKRMNNLEKEYFEMFHTVDQKCDIYLFNILSLAILLNKNKFSSAWLPFIKFGNLELDKIVAFLAEYRNVEYAKNFIIDYMPDNEKEFKKLTRKIR